MKKQTFRIAKEYPLDGHKEWGVIEGYGVIIPGFDEFTFFVHKAPLLPTFETKWRISEETSGRAFPEELDRKTRQATIEAVTTFLTDKGKPFFIEVLEEARATNKGIK